MNHTMIYIRLDVDGTRYYGSALRKHTSEVIDFQCRPHGRGRWRSFTLTTLVTIVQPPDAEQERDRDLLRARQNLLKHRTDLRKHRQSLLRRGGLHYKAETGNKSHWTQLHYARRDRTIDGLSGSIKRNL